MRYPPVRYRLTDDANRLELDCWNGTSRSIVFGGPSDVEQALRPGRAEFDCGAVGSGLLPLGAVFASKSVVAPVLVYGDEEERAAIQAIIDTTADVTPESDREARIRRPREAANYASLLSTMTVRPRKDLR